MAAVLFKGKHFVISRTEDKSIISKIKKNGGCIKEKLSPKVSYFVQGYNVEDDDRLGEAHDYGVTVIPPSYLLACIDDGAMLDITEHAIGAQAKQHPMASPAVKQFFRPPSEECREHEEQPQTYDEFLLMERYVLQPNRRTIALIPIVSVDFHGYKERLVHPDDVTIPSSTCKALELLQTFMKSYFSLDVTIQKKILFNISKNGGKLYLKDYGYEVQVKTHKGRRRVNVMDLIDAISENVEETTFCCLGVTTETIYEQDDSEDPLLGRATGDRAGVLSLGTYLSSLQIADQAKLKGSTCAMDKSTKCTLLSLFNTAAHETMHMFGLDHCVYFSCVMNAWSDPDLDADEEMEEDHPTTAPVVPLHLCPIDLRKLEAAIGFNVLSRYENLLNFYESMGFTNHAKWLKCLIDQIEHEKEDQMNK